MSVIITVRMLERARACENSIEDFRVLFGESTEVTLAKAEMVCELFDFFWATLALLTIRGHQAANKEVADAREERNRGLTDLVNARDARCRLDANECVSKSYKERELQLRRLIEQADEWAERRRWEHFDFGQTVARAFVTAALTHGLRYDVDGEPIS